MPCLLKTGSPRRVRCAGRCWLEFGVANAGCGTGKPHSRRAHSQQPDSYGQATVRRQPHPATAQDARWRGSQPMVGQTRTMLNGYAAGGRYRETSSAIQRAPRLVRPRTGTYRDTPLRQRVQYPPARPIGLRHSSPEERRSSRYVSALCRCDAMTAKASEITSHRLGHGRPVRSVGDRRRGLACRVLTVDPVTGRRAGRKCLRRGDQRLWCPVCRGISVEVAARAQAGLSAGRERGGGGDVPHGQGWAGEAPRIWRCRRRPAYASPMVAAGRPLL